MSKKINEAVQVRKLEIVCCSRSENNFEATLKKAGYELGSYNTIGFVCQGCQAVVTTTVGIVTNNSWPVPFIVYPFIEGHEGHKPGCVLAKTWIEC